MFICFFLTSCSTWASLQCRLIERTVWNWKFPPSVSHLQMICLQRKQTSLALNVEPLLRIEVSGGFDGSATWPERPREDWRVVSCWKHSRENGPEVKDGPRSFIISDLAWSHHCHWLLKSISRPPRVAATLPGEKTGLKCEWVVSYALQQLLVHYS